VRAAGAGSGEVQVSELRSWFLRNVFETIERQHGGNAMAELRARLAPRLAAHVSLERLRRSAALDTVPLDEGEELLLAVDATFGDGSGKVLETVGTELAGRVLSQGGGVALTGDLVGTVARLQAFLEHPFVGVPLVFELRRTRLGFSLTIGVTGHSRATRALRHLAVGAIFAAERYAREVGADNLKIYAESIADRASISARYLVTEEPLEEDAAPPSRRPHTARPPTTSLSDEVERILRTSVPPRRASDPPPAMPNRKPSSLPPPPRVPSTFADTDDGNPPKSTTLPRAAALSQSSIPASKKTS